MNRVTVVAVATMTLGIPAAAHAVSSSTLAGPDPERVSSAADVDPSAADQATNQATNQAASDASRMVWLDGSGDTWYQSDPSLTASPFQETYPQSEGEADVRRFAVVAGRNAISFSADYVEAAPIQDPDANDLYYRATTLTANRADGDIRPLAITARDLGLPDRLRVVISEVDGAIVPCEAATIRQSFERRDVRVRVPYRCLSGRGDYLVQPFSTYECVDEQCGRDDPQSVGSEPGPVATLTPR